MSGEKERKALSPKQRFLRAMELPYNSMGKCIKLFVFDNVRAQLEGVDSIIEYDENIVKLGSGKTVITFVGDKFKISEYSPEITVVEGAINEVRYDRRAKK